MKIDRLIGILSILLQQDKVTAPFLAETFEVSRRTILRDLENLCKAGIPLVTTQGKNGGIAIMPGYSIERTLLTSTEMQALLAGLRSLDSVSKTNRYQQLMTKLCGGNTALLAANHFAIDLSSWYKSSLAPKIQLIEHAIEAHTLISFSYYAPKGQSTRTIEPYLIVFHWASWYVWGYCTEKQDFRLFKLNRILQLEASAEDFVPRDHPPFTMQTERIFPPNVPVCARFAPALEWRLIEEYGPDSFTKEADGTLLFRFFFPDESSALSWLLSFGETVELLEPLSLRERLRDVTQRMSEKYL